MRFFFWNFENQFSSWKNIIFHPDFFSWQDIIMEIRFLASIRVSDQFDDLGASCSKNTCKKQGEVAVITTYTMAASYISRIPFLSLYCDPPRIPSNLFLFPRMGIFAVIRITFSEATDFSLQYELRKCSSSMRITEQFSFCHWMSFYPGFLVRGFYPLPK